ncbi:MAG: hypothetical protein DRO73_09165 [Candidatus Thorarchaeota archaeon]|nr:MAG: hypothetical protein DRO73_09165 [Candidatus Thorarchaeota archaeon]
MPSESPRQIGIYNRPLVVFDEGGNHVSDKMMVTVVLETTTTTTTSTVTTGITASSTTTGTATSSTGCVSTSPEVKALAQTILVGVAAARTIVVVGLIVVMLRRHGDSCCECTDGECDGLRAATVRACSHPSGGCW